MDLRVLILLGLRRLGLSLAVSGVGARIFEVVAIARGNCPSAEITEILLALAILGVAGHEIAAPVLRYNSSAVGTISVFLVFLFDFEHCVVGDLFG